jgi:hypothetical protein
VERFLTLGVALTLAFGVLTAWVADPWAVFLLYGLVFLLGGVWAAGLLLGPRPVRTRLVRPRQVRFNFAMALLGMAATWGAAQLVFGATVNRWDTMNSTFLWIANATMYFLALQLFSNQDRRSAFLRWLLYGTMALAVEALFQLYTAGGRVFWIFRIPDHPEIIMGPVPYHNHFAAIVVLVLPIAVYLAFLDAKNLMVYGWTIALLAGAVFASQSRSGAVLVVLELIALSPLVGRQWSTRARMARAGVVLTLVIAGAAVAGWEGLWARLRLGDSTRLITSKTSLEMTAQAPLAGYGLGTWHTVYPMFAHYDDGLFMNQGHDDWLQWAAEGGVPFAAIVAAFALIVSLQAWRVRWGLGIPAVLILCFGDFPLQKPAVALLVFTLAGTVSASVPWRPDRPNV